MADFNIIFAPHNLTAVLQQDRTIVLRWECQGTASSYRVWVDGEFFRTVRGNECHVPLGRRENVAFSVEAYGSDGTKSEATHLMWTNPMVQQVRAKVARETEYADVAGWGQF